MRPHPLSPVAKASGFGPVVNGWLSLYYAKTSRARATETQARSRSSQASSTFHSSYLSLPNRAAPASGRQGSGLAGPGRAAPFARRSSFSSRARGGGTKARGPEVASEPRTWGRRSPEETDEGPVSTWSSSSRRSSRRAGRTEYHGGRDLCVPVASHSTRTLSTSGGEGRGASGPLGRPAAGYGRRTGGRGR